MSTTPARTTTERLWPLFGLRLRTERLELDPVSDDDLGELAAVARAGIHASERSPFRRDWTALGGAAFDRSFAQYFWAQRASWSAASWSLPFTVRVDGAPAGVQQLSARRFPERRVVGTSSWLGLEWQGRGLGTEMRAAVLHLAFDHLDAHAAVTYAFPWNRASLRVSEKLGYESDGVRRWSEGGVARVERRLRLVRSRWLEHDDGTVHAEGVAEALSAFGLGPPEVSV